MRHIVVPMMNIGRQPKQLKPTFLVQQRIIRLYQLLHLLKEISIMKQSSKTDCYKDKNVFVGIDVHKRTYAVVSFVDGVVVKKWQTVASPEALARQLKDLYPYSKIRTAYEAGFSGFVLHRVLEQAGIHNLVVNPGSIEVSIHNRVKTDKRDAQKIASLLEAGRAKRDFVYLQNR